MEREVREETGIEAKFEGVVGLREQLGFKYDCADFYFVSCLTLADESNIKTAIQDVNEVQLAEWVNLDKINETNDEKSEVYLYPNAYKFTRLVQSCLKDVEPEEFKAVMR